jgi:hypothetical protein
MILSIVNRGKNRFGVNESNIKGSLGREKKIILFRLILVVHIHTLLALILKTMNEFDDKTRNFASS